MKKVLVILGPTATGKTETALYLGKKFNGQLVACDSRQVYQGLDIGTGKYPNSKFTKADGYWIINGVKIWMYDVAHLQKQYSAADYVKDASMVIDQINLPIIVGGTGFYLKALLEGFDSLSVPENLELRRQMKGMSLLQLQKKLQQIVKDKWDKLNESDKQNPRRLLRLIEISMYPYNKIRNTNCFSNCLRQDETRNWDILKIGLTASREVLYKNVDSRIYQWFKDGIIDEVKGLLAEGIAFDRFEKLGLEYRLIAQYLNEQFKSKEGLIKMIKGSLHSYVRRQQTWFKKEVDVSWFDITEVDFLDKIELVVSKWYHTNNA